MSQHEQFCQACGMPMSAPDAHSASNQYCAYCSDSNGNLKPWEEAVSGTASFLDSGKSRPGRSTEASKTLPDGNASLGS